MGLSSSAWVCSPNADVHRNLAFVLADSGFDVWIVNGRGANATETRQKSTESKPWDFSIDEISYYDVPAVVDYVLNMTGRQSVAYVGFSQGSTAALAALSISDELNKKINVCVCLAPPIQPSLPENKVLRSVILKMGPEILYKVLGREQFLKIAQTWLPLTPPHFNSFVIRKAFEILFGWDCSSFGCRDRQAAVLSHSFWGVPVKNMVQWFQIITENSSVLHYNSFQEKKAFSHTTERTFAPVKYPLKQISTNLYLFVGAADNLCDISVGKQYLPPHARLTLIKNYNHLDLIWAVDAKEKVWDHLIPILKNPYAETRIALKKTVSFARGTNYDPQPVRGTITTDVFAAWSSRFKSMGMPRDEEVQRKEVGEKFSRALMETMEGSKFFIDDSEDSDDEHIYSPEQDAIGAAYEQHTMDIVDVLDRIGDELHLDSLEVTPNESSLNNRTEQWLKSLETQLPIRSSEYILDNSSQGQEAK
ncbi:alpha/beta-hydrolase [Rhizoclosmatium globosum]|uniref:Alpha/beta-hydrolase n=1 Tax=Rhizoclosmatium globosum TaxID=329046 RepID=A0A1Y2CZM2_9FUNG|nr:alpha/beta-hydrolase [Rhizoclosmatium globosum]|eukprot:ORY52481.1 alpha/beta-hydrolase [Rhizoclosmatium globosum]